jgi:signal transduction histidine kinase
MDRESPSTIVATPRGLPIVAAALGSAIFVLDCFTPPEIDAAVLYVGIVLMAVRFYRPPGVLIVAAGCVALAVLSDLLSSGDFWRTTALANRLIGILAIGVTTLLVLRNQSAQMALHRAELARATRLMTLGELTASIGHEINQPVGAVVTNADAGLLWLDAEPPDIEEARQALDRIVKEGNRASEVIARIRALVKGTPPRKDWLKINETILEVVALTRSDAQRNGVSLQTQLSGDLPLIPGDRIQLQQVILNLLANAIDAMREVDEYQRELLVGSRKHESDTVLVEVRDSGAGLDTGGLNRVFEAFYTSKPDGMGMGLAISRSIVEAHGGRLWAAHNVPKGAVFQFTLPTVGSSSIAQLNTPPPPQAR